jgi:cyclomaltodextrinase
MSCARCWEDAIWYYIYPLGFLGAEDDNPAPGASAGPVVHRLPGLVDWLDYLVDLGISALLIGPVFESETHGYDVVDPYRVDRRLGTEADLVYLIDECHRRSLSVGLDAVFHHVGRANPYFLDLQTHGRQSAWHDWFQVDFDRPGPDGFAYATFEGHKQLVKLNHANRQVLDWAVDVARYWIERGVDAFRLDAAYALPPHFVKAFVERTRALRPDIFLVGEVIHGDYVRTARQTRLSTLTQYELWKAIWSSLNDGNLFELAHALQRHADFCQHFLPWNFVGNHDTTRIATQLVDRQLLSHALAVLFTLPGIPAVYAGDEQNAKGRKYDRAGGDAKIRRPLKFRPGELEGESHRIWNLHRDLIAVRHGRPWLATGKLDVTHVDNRLLTYEVHSGTQRVVVALNTDNKPAKCKLPPALATVAGHSESTLPPHGWGIWSS